MNQKLHVMKRFSNWVVLVTGGASGIGRATSVRLASEGAQVIIADKDTELGEKAVSNIEQNGGQAVFIPVNLANDDSVKSAGQAVAQSYLSLDAIVNNAAILRQGRIEDGSWLENWDPETRIGLRGWVLMTQELLPLMKQRGGGIVNLSSEGGFLGRPNQWVYDAIKSGLVSLTKTMAAEFVNYGIRVNAVAPGWIVTEMHFGNHENPEKRKKELETSTIKSCIMGRLGTAEEIASVITFLLSDDASYITGQTIHVDGGRWGMSVGN